jgi:hypothetical protein
MLTHKFKIGQIVYLKPFLTKNIPGGVYVITKRLPERNGEFEYRVRSGDELYERVVRESELTKGS